MQATYNKLLDWYKKQPWWGKVLFFGVFILLGVLFIAFNFSSLFAGTGFVSPKKISTSPPFGKINESLDVQIENAKKVLLTRLETVRQVGVRSMERQKAIQKATTMEELDKLKEKYGL
jgi:hypothetical protein